MRSQGSESAAHPLVLSENVSKRRNGIFSRQEADRVSKIEASSMHAEGLPQTSAAA
jgi:hypothetical protein